MFRRPQRKVYVIFILYIVSLYISDALEKISSHYCRNLQSYMQQTAEHNFCEYHKVKSTENGKNHKFGSGDQNIDLGSNLRPHSRKIWSRYRFFVFMTFWFCEVFGQQSMICHFSKTKIWGVQFFGPPPGALVYIFCPKSKFHHK